MRVQSEGRRRGSCLSSSSSPPSFAFTFSSPRPDIALLRKDDLLDQFSLICSDISVHSFKHVKTVKQAKDGGVFVRFTYVPLPEGEGGSEKALTEVEKAFNDAATKLGGLKTWSWLGGGKVWRVLGRPWHEVSSRADERRGRVGNSRADLVMCAFEGSQPVP